MASVSELAEMQLDLLPADAGPDAEEVDESAGAVDVAASIALAEEEEAALARVGEVIEAPFYEDRDRYRKYVVQMVDAMELANIGGREIVAVHARVAKGVANRLPKPWGLARLLALLVYDQTVRDRAGKPLRFSSLHRSLAYNAKIGGATRSQHPACTARDRALVGGSVSQNVADLLAIDRSLRGKRVDLTDRQQLVIHTVRDDYALTSPPFSGRVFSEPFDAGGIQWDGTGYVHLGGLGRYSTFVHADCRGTARDF